uniref:Uncharacterized protein n=1 Tax=Avena sativa TaxID=4498 RepID=A0ACD5WPK3_AVESA
MLYTPAMSAREREEETAHNRIFMEFMAGVARFEELVDGGRGVLARFQKELEYFRRQWVPIESDVMDEIVRSNCTHRMRSYLESGCSLPYQNISNLRHLHSCERELEGYINEANVVLKRLECLVEDAYDATLTANLSAVKVLDYSTADSKMKHVKVLATSPFRHC